MSKQVLHSNDFQLIYNQFKEALVLEKLWIKPNNCETNGLALTRPYVMSLDRHRSYDTVRLGFGKSKYYMLNVDGEQNTFNKLLNMTAGLKSADVQVLCAQFQLSLKCPISGKRIEHPGRLALCQHVDCFDIVSFLKMHEQRRGFRRGESWWRCPICRASQLSNDDNIIIDSLMENILNVFGMDCKSVTVSRGSESTSNKAVNRHKVKSEKVNIITID